MKVLGILQEFATCVGNLNSINTVNAMGAGHGVQVIYEVQDLNQLVALMPNGNGFMTYLAQTGFQIYLGAGLGDLFTARHVSAMSGTVDVPTVSRSIQDGQQPGFQVPSGALDAIDRSLRSLGSSGGNQVSIGTRQKPFLLPEDVTDLPREEMIVFAESVPGLIRAGRKNYYDDPECASRAGKNPHYDKKS